MAKIVLDLGAVRDWDSLHDALAEAFGFPAFCGRNMNAWIDCLTYLDEDDGMSRTGLKPGETLRVELVGSRALSERAPEQALALFALFEATNERRRADGKPPMLAVILAERSEAG